MMPVFPGVYPADGLRNIDLTAMPAANVAGFFSELKPHLHTDIGAVWCINAFGACAEVRPVG